MGLAYRDEFLASTAVSSWPGRFAAPQAIAPVPDDLAFLRAYGTEDDLLRAAVRSAERSGVMASEALIANGGVSDCLYYYSLARHLGLTFTLNRPQLSADADALFALRTGRVALAGGGWLAAPTGDELRAVLAAGWSRGAPDRNVTITTPAHFAATIFHRLHEQVALAVADALPVAAPHLSARNVADWRSGLTFLAVGLCFALGLLAGWWGVVDVVACVFFAGLVFRLLVSARGLKTERVPDPTISDCDAPLYTVLVPLYREPAMVPGLVASLRALDYPAAKLEILFLTEADDATTRLALLAKALPPHMRVVVVPDGQPRTKPRALNAGLLCARGEIITVYDAEDHPAPDQLRQAASRFRREPPDLGCLQARLVVSNAAQGLLPRLFAIEYAALFDVYNVGAIRLGLPIALGGTSNHFRSSVLREVGGWDAFNVTEDADLGLRLARFGFRVGDLPSSTAEDAERSPIRWFNQRRRWMKGWMQTSLVLMRPGGASARDFGLLRSAVVVLILTNLIAGPLLSPLAIALVSLHFALTGLPHPAGFVQICEATVAASVFLLGIAAPVWCGYVGMRARGLRALGTLPVLIPYQLLICAAAWGGLIDLLHRPHHWRKTPHTARTPLSHAPTRSLP